MKDFLLVFLVVVGAPFLIGRSLAAHRPVQGVLVVVVEGCIVGLCLGLRRRKQMRGVK